jgi:hypothetical protein
VTAAAASRLRDVIESLTATDSPPHRGRRYSVGAVSVAVHAEPEALDWCEHYLAPSVASSTLEADAVCAFVIHAIHDREAWRRVRSAVDGVDSTASHTYNRTPIREWALGDGLYVHQYVARKAVTVIDVDRGVIAFVDDCRSDHEWWMEPSRLIRESITRRLEEDSTFVFHAGSVALGGRAAVFVGHKRAGKTTLTVAALEYAGAGYIANDRAYIDVAGGRPSVRGWPVTAALGIGTCLASPTLRSLVEGGVKSRYPQPTLESRLDLDEFRRRDAPAMMHERVKIELTPLEMGETFGVPVVAAQTLNALVFPELDPGCARPDVRRLAPADAAVRLGEQILTCDAVEYPDWLHLRRASDVETQARVSSVADRLLHAVPAFTLRYWDPAAAAQALCENLSATEVTPFITDPDQRTQFFDPTMPAS